MSREPPSTCHPKLSPLKPLSCSPWVENSPEPTPRKSLCLSLVPAPAQSTTPSPARSLPLPQALIFSSFPPDCVEVRILHHATVLLSHALTLNLASLETLKL